MKTTDKIWYGLLAIILILAGVLLLLVNDLSIPSRYGARPMLVSPPTTYFIAALPLSLGIALIIYLMDAKKYRSLCKKIVAIGLVLACIGLVIVGPLLNH